jgi:hypothetical protein
VNRPLPARNRGHRSGDPGWQSSASWIVLGPQGLVDGTENPRRRAAPPTRCSAAQGGRLWWTSGFNGVATLAVISLDGGYRQSHALPHGPGQKPAHRVGLPVCGLHEFLHAGSFGSLQEFEHSGCLATVPGAPGGALRDLRRLSPFGLPRRDVRAACPSTGLLSALGCLGNPSGLGGNGVSCNRFGHFRCSFRGDYRGGDINRSDRLHKQGKSASRREQTAMAALRKVWRPI